MFDLPGFTLRQRNALLGFLGSEEIPHDGTLKGINDALQELLESAEQKKSRVEKGTAVPVLKNPEVALEYFRELGLMDEVYPQRNHYDHVIIHGAALAGIMKRVNFWQILIENGVKTDHVWFVASKRKLQPRDRLYISDIAQTIAEKKWKLFPFSVDVETEEELCLVVFRCGRYGGVVTVSGAPLVKDSVEDKERVPNTEEAVRHWYHTHLPKPGSVLVISSGPSTVRQGFATRRVLEPLGFEIEAVGPATELSPVVTPDYIMQELIKWVYEVYQASLIS